MFQKKVGIITFDNAEVLDVMGPFEVFSVAGRISEPSKFQVLLVSDSQQKSVTLRHGLRILTDRNIFEEHEFDLIIVSGGITTNAEQNKNLLEFLVKYKTLSWGKSLPVHFLLKLSDIHFVNHSKRKSQLIHGR